MTSIEVTSLGAGLPLPLQLGSSSVASLREPENMWPTAISRYCSWRRTTTCCACEHFSDPGTRHAAPTRGYRRPQPGTGRQKLCHAHACGLQEGHAVRDGGSQGARCPRGG